MISVIVIVVNTSSKSESDPRLLTQPVDAVVAIGEDAEFNFSFDGTSPITVDVQEFKY